MTRPRPALFCGLAWLAMNAGASGAEPVAKASNEPLAGSRTRIRTSYRTSATTGARGMSPLDRASADQNVSDKLAAVLSPSTSRASSRELQTPRYMACLSGGKRRPIANYRDDGDSFWISWIEGGHARYGKSMIDRFESLSEEQAAAVLAELQTAQASNAGPRGLRPTPGGQATGAIDSANDKPAAPRRNSGPRRYRDGPLAASDFTGQPPAKRGTIVAYTYSAVTYDYRYRTIVYPGAVRVIATSLTAEALLIPDKSWNAAPWDQRLLDHEQGHFDITQLHTSSWQRQMAQSMDRGSLAAGGPNQAAAYQSLQATVQAEFQSAIDQWKSEQLRYDDETKHGIDARRQSQWRQRLDEQLRGGLSFD